MIQRESSVLAQEYLSPTIDGSYNNNALNNYVGLPWILSILQFFLQPYKT